MGASICQSNSVVNDQELIKEQLDLQPKSFDSKCDHSQIQVQPIENQIKDEEQIQDSSSVNDNLEAITPYLPYNQEQQQQQYIQLLNTEMIQSIKFQSQLVSSQNEDILQQSKQQQQSDSSYPMFCKNKDKGNQFLNMQIIDDNLDDYINYDWKNSKFQLISINDQNLLKKSSSSKPKTYQKKK